MLSTDLGQLSYREAWAEQERAHEEVFHGGEERVFFVEHPPVITYGRRPGVEKNVITPADQLAKLGVDVVQSDRGGDVTFHGPGQIVMYPIIRLADYKLSVSAYVRLLLDVVVDALADFQIPAEVEKEAIGVWVGEGKDRAKICALGVRIRRGVSMHGIALNITTDLEYFQLIVPCGLVGRGVTSMAKILSENVPTRQAVISRLGYHFERRLGALSCG